MMNTNNLNYARCTSHFIAAILLSLLATNAIAGHWQLDQASSAIQFLSVKNETITERHRFASLHGKIDPDGKVELHIDLHAVETNIPIRNERMRSLLFHTHKVATFTANLGTNFEANASTIHQINGVLHMNGVRQHIRIDVEVIPMSPQQIIVNTLQPINIDVADYNMLPGIEALRKIASLMSIEPVVPVTFSLLLNRQ